MRPVRLEITGLNSFSETQVVAFDQLSETGVFGIFGPTGSGKSSILDAITLALYGTVERAANHTQGILNHGAERLSVKYTFSLGEGKRRKNYRAERSYKRSGERTVTASVCRLVEENCGQEKVLAAKEKEMTKALEGILGLNSEDFTRAVVLPQGKFAEFLTIKPRERREMLERLFALEAYGKGLSTRLTEQLKQTEFDLHGVEKEQQGLGDASAERLRQAETEYNEAIIVAAGAEQQLATLRSLYETAKEIWDLQEELRQNGERKKAWEARRSAVADRQKRLGLAEAAESLRPLLIALKQAEEAQREARRKESELKARLREAELDREKAAGVWQKANEERLSREPGILRRLERLEQAIQLEKEIAERKNLLGNLRNRYSSEAKKKEEWAGNLEAVAGKLREVKMSWEAKKKRLADIQVPSLQRVKVNALAQALDVLQVLSGQIGSLEKDCARNQAEEETWQGEVSRKKSLAEKALAESDGLKEALLDLQDHPPGDEETLATRAVVYERFKARLDKIEQAEKELREEKERLELGLADSLGRGERLEALERECAGALRHKEEAGAEEANQAGLLKTLETKNLAGILAQELVEGKSCPVCGSEHHPLPAQAPAAEEVVRARTTLEEAKETRTKWEERVRTIETRLAVERAQAQTLLDQLEDQKISLRLKAAGVAELRELLPEGDRDKSLTGLRNELEAKLTGLEKERAALLRWRQTKNDTQEKLEKAQSTSARAQEETGRAQVHYAAATRAVKDSLERLAGLREELDRKQKELDAARGDIHLEDIANLQKTYAEWDSEAEQINRSLAGAEVEIKALTEKQQEMQEEGNQRELNLQELAISGRELKKALDIDEGRLREVTGGEPAVSLAGAEGAKLAELKRLEEESKKALEGAQTRQNRAEQDQAAVSKEVDLKEQGLKETEVKLSQGLRLAGFVSAAAAEASLCNEQERRQMTEEIKTFQQEESFLKENQSQIEARLEGRSISPAEWLAWPVRLKDAGRVHNEAMERRGVLQNTFLQLKEKQAQWETLDKQRKSLSHHLALQKELQNILKGNTFVEFIAEEQLIHVAYDASERLAQLTNYRYALEVDSEGGFVVRDDANGGYRRPVNSLSGGETFLTSLALALALSSQIQLRGEVPLEFFFLDEGFGTLDTELLEIVMTTLEKLRLQNLTIGIISHVPELRHRLARRIIVIPARPGGAGSRVRLEMG
ncbi:Putative exonuclease SbcCD, C subunit [Acididesulfobacillus acetoxydans]|uniref:Nuclease SbcCD subunit C n=1 Tax=Acididesulfobacillus acetoxydans TaxID=1561005 RepID=A0A8S0VVR2_9FIRM|nr:AAA family ATPase [Acididesulfobacillus acetoxydans]CAA7599983.1 Putative exonuclease SbcCD, C subunit [Acididesulfobacillus acetoxydans]CEJ05976.1 Nuclease SbcCD subunit C [Acididesulfobacillus acetoxydans]